MKFSQLVATVMCLIPALVFAHPAEDLVKQVTEDLITVLEDPAARNDKKLVREAVDRDVLPHIDFELMTKLTVGTHWKTADAGQRESLVGEFRDLLLNTYASALDAYSGQSLEFLPYEEGSRDDRAEVKTLFLNPAATQNIPVDYKLRKKGSWLIYDIEVENISLVRGYESEFASQIKKGGIDGLINALRSKNGK